MEQNNSLHIVTITCLLQTKTYVIVDSLGLNQNKLVIWYDMEEHIQFELRAIPVKIVNLCY